MTHMAFAEPLESRTLFAAVLEGGMLSVFGTVDADTITVENPSGSAVVVTINGTAQTFNDLAAITAIKVRGFAGNDTITVGSITAASQPAGRRVDVGGGGGNDTITTSGAAPDRYLVEGDDGNDTITGSNATLSGGAGSDTLTLTGTGRIRNKDFRSADTLITPRGIEITGGGPKLTIRGKKLTVVGSAAADTIDITPVAAAAADGTVSLKVTLNTASFTFNNTKVGRIEVGAGGGDDTVRLSPATGNGPAFAGRSDLRGGDGNDTITGGDGRDAIYGDAGTDTLDGRAGDDSLFGGDGNDTITGGTGADGMSGDAGDDTFNNRDRTSATKRNDVVVGGPGNDSADDEFADTILQVEVFRAATA